MESYIGECENCRFVEKIGAATYGYKYLCHRFPPPRTSAQSDDARFLRVRRNDWCGEFKERAGD